MDQSSKHSPRAEPALDVELEPQELSDELGDLDEQIEHELEDLPEALEALGETLGGAPPRSQEPPRPPTPPRERPPRPSPLQPVATLTALPLRITARILRAQAD